MQTWRWERADTFLCAGLALLGLATRALLRANGLTTLDSGLLAVAVVDYDFVEVRPHPPYYPLTVALGKWMASAVGPVDALSWLSVLATGVLVAATYAVARHVVGRVAAVGAALLVVASPMALANGTAPLSYALEGAASAVVALAALRARRIPGPANWAALGLFASIAVGIRPSSLFLLAPLAMWGAGLRLRALAWTAGTGIAATVAWLLPAVVAGGGLDPFLFGLSVQSRVFILSNPVWVGGWAAVQDNLAHLVLYVRFEGLFLVAVALAGTVASAAVVPRLRDAPSGFFAAWALPAVAFYSLVYAGWPVFPDGYLLALIPAAAVGCARLLEAIVAAVREPIVPRAAQMGGVVAVAALCVLPAFWLGDWDDALALQNDAEAWSDSWSGMETVLLPNETALLVFYGSPWIELEHPDYLAWHLQPFSPAPGVWQIQVAQSRGLQFDKSALENLRDGPDPPHPIPSGIRQIVLFQGHPLDGGYRLVRDGISVLPVVLPSGATVSVVATEGVATLEELLP
ncbi:MAG: hypothetical protein AABX89_01280 [Candidatus Thermoplasmatota archaeon]